MNDKLTALDKLIDAVEAGEIRTGVTGLKAFEQFSLDAFGLYQSNAAWRAYGGSLDAALALHEALLPGWIARVTTGAAGVNYSHCTVEDWNDATEVDANNQPTPARAWLLSILRAYRSMQA